MSDPDRNKLDDDDVLNDIMDQIARANETLDEAKRLTDNKKLQERLVMQDVKVENLKQTFDLKVKQLQVLNDQLKNKKADAVQRQTQRSQTFDILAKVFKDTQKFSSKAGHEINQAFQSLGLDIEFVGQAVVKIEKDGKWFQLGLDDNLKLSLIDMNPRHSRFNEIQNLFAETRNIVGLLSIYGWLFDD